MVFETYFKARDFAREERIKRNISQLEMSKICFVGRNSINKFELSPSWRNVDLLERYFEHFGIPIQYIAKRKQVKSDGTK